jgi:hypothetical protein
MGGKELCPQCQPHNKCLFEEAISTFDPNDIDETIIANYASYAKERQCVKVKETILFAVEKMVLTKAQKKPNQGSNQEKPPR